MIFPDFFTSARLSFSPVIMEDAAAVFEAWGQDADVTRYLTWRPHRSIADAEAWAKMCKAEWENGSSYSYLARRADTGLLCGALALRPNGHRCEFGYLVAKAFWGQGFGKEIAQTAIHQSLEAPGIVRVWAYTDIDNVHSARVLEQCGMAREGVLRAWSMHPNISSRPRDVISFSLVRS